jgi:hypothetical protein
MRPHSGPGAVVLAAAAEAGLRPFHHPLPSVSSPTPQHRPPRSIAHSAASPTPQHRPLRSSTHRICRSRRALSYTSQQIQQLLQLRLSAAAPHCGRAGMFEERALDFCARKCAGLTGGDFRRCLDFCRHALAASVQRQQKQGGAAGPLTHVRLRLRLLRPCEIVTLRSRSACPT